MARDDWSDQEAGAGDQDSGDFAAPDWVTEKPYVLLRPVPPERVWRPDIDPADIIEWPVLDDVTALVSLLARASILVVDLETRGTEAWRDDSAIVGFGLAWRTGDKLGTRYFNWTTMTDEMRAYLLGVVRISPAARVAHNLMFEGSWLDRECDRLGASRIEWTYCTYALMRQLAGEGFPSQSYSLKSAQLDLLGWTETNERGIDEWLLAHGYHKQGPRPVEGDSPEQHLRALREWVSVNPASRRASPEKGEMWRVPPRTLGEYCALDCLSTLQLLEDVLLPALTRFRELDEFHRADFVEMDRILWTSTDDGVPIDIEKMRAHAEYLVALRRRATRQMRESLLGPHIRAYEAELRVPLIASEPTKYKKFVLGEEPPRHTAAGTEAKRWQVWDAKRREGPQISKNWEAWRERLDAAERGDSPEYSFNPDSPDDLRRVLFESGLVQWRPTERTSYKKGKQIPIFEVRGVHGWVDLPGTDAGLLPANGDLYGQLPPEIGLPLQVFADASQELGYADAYVALAHLHSDGIHRIHFGWISPGTKTLRLAGGGGKRPVENRAGKTKEVSANAQQCPKTQQFMECMYAEPGQVWFEMDWSALEPHCLAELTRDPALVRLYGPGAKKHDVYLYSGAGYAVLGDEIRKYYDIENPDVATAKKKLKQVREACKVVVLAKSYGAGAKKIHAGLRLKGFDLTEEQAAQISASHDAMYAASGRKFHALLEDEWEARGGWVMSAHGFPCCVWEGAKKDLINRVIQRSGHDCHTMFVVRLERRLQSEGIAHKWVIPDFHDQLIGSCAEADGGRVLDIIRDEVTRFNDELGAYIPLKGEPKLSRDLAHAKETEFQWPDYVKKMTKGWVV